jgi:hypothetical protein
VWVFSVSMYLSIQYIYICVCCGVENCVCWEREREREREITLCKWMIRSLLLSLNETFENIELFIIFLKSLFIIDRIELFLFERNCLIRSTCSRAYFSHTFQCDSSLFPLWESFSFQISSNYRHSVVCFSFQCMNSHNFTWELSEKVKCEILTCFMTVQ